MTPGKLAAQVAHAAVSAVVTNPKYHKVTSWLEEGQTKVVLQAKDETELFQLQEKARQKDIKTALIKDAGRTELAEGTVTCLAIGPDEDSKVDSITGGLKLL